MTHRAVLSCCVWALAGCAAAAADFAPVSDAERALSAVPGEPNAPAVVLARRGEFLMMGYGREGSSSILRLEGRIKILTEEGKSNGEVAVYHSDLARLQSFEGRTVLPDGRVIPVAADAKFVRKQSRSEKRFVTAVAFPAVQVGAILDYRYEIKFESIFYLEPWYFSDDVPVLYSEIVYKIPGEVLAQTWSRGLSGVKLERQTKASSRGTELTVWGRNFPAVPTEPFGPPFRDLASQMMLLPTALHTQLTHQRLFETWASVCEMADWGYGKAHRSDSGVPKKAKEVAGAGAATEQAGRLFRFVRDEIVSEEVGGIGLGEDASVGKVLANRRGSYTEKALLLQAMLEAVKIDARLVWAADRRNGTIDSQLADPHWFDTVLVLVELDGKRVFLDPSDSAVAFGYLRPGFEGTPALIFDPKKPEGIQTVKAWTEWLGESFEDFRVGEVQVAEIPDERRVTLSWTLSQREEEVLGDEATIVPSAPVGPATQPFVQPAGARKTPVIFDFPDRDEVSLTVRWAEGWKIAGRPNPAAVSNSAGALATEVEAREAERLLIYKRRFDVVKPSFASSADYEMLRSLFAAAEKSDAETLLLVRR